VDYHGHGGVDWCYWKGIVPVEIVSLPFGGCVRINRIVEKYQFQQNRKIERKYFSKQKCS